MEFTAWSGEDYAMKGGVKNESRYSAVGPVAQSFFPLNFKYL
jgi:hypothetical protein